MRIRSTSLLLLGILAAGGLWAAARQGTRAAAPDPGVDIAEGLRGFRDTASVLMVGAHPDDEDTQLIAYLARARGVRTAYLSVTRGDGGQNLLGSELGSDLGFIRTQELLAARSVDHGEQFFTRAIDFGFSKDYKSTLDTWGHQEVLSDVVRVIRTFQPDVIVTVFPYPPTGFTHGQHTASSELAQEAFPLAADPKAFPDQLKTLGVWQPRLLVQDSRGGRGEGAALTLEVGGVDPVTGESILEVAAQSRAMHKTQGFGGYTGGGAGGGTGGGNGAGTRLTSFLRIAGTAPPGGGDLLGGIDATWSRYPGGAPLAALADRLIAEFNPKDTAAIAPDLLRARSLLAPLPHNALTDARRTQLDRLLAESIGLVVSNHVDHREVAPGEKLTIHAGVSLVSNAEPVRWISPLQPESGTALVPNGAARTQEFSLTLPANAPVSQPYWLRTEGTAGLYQVEDLNLIGRPNNPPVLPIQDVFDIGGQRVTLEADPVEVRNGWNLPLDVIAPVAVSFTEPMQLFAPGSTRTVTVRLQPERPGQSGPVALSLPPGWRTQPASQSVAVAADGASANFQVTAPAATQRADFGAGITLGGRSYTSGRHEIDYAHLAPILLQPTARLTATSLDLKTTGTKVGYIAGSGDDLPAAMRQMGYQVKELQPADLNPAGLTGLDDIVLGVRVFNTRKDLDTVMPALFDYVNRGGTVIELYSQNVGLTSQTLAPYPMRLGASPTDRVVDVNSEMTELDPSSPVFNTPNKIAAADWSGWVQERGAYFAESWDSHFKPLLSLHDPGAEPLQGSLLVADYGKGVWIYTALSFFRQLPAGTPGAYRLFANLLALRGQ